MTAARERHLAACHLTDEAKQEIRGGTGPDERRAGTDRAAQ
ncbi:hypothetical protein ABZZ16_41625 [Streptomyces sp. NPDC006386]